MTRQPDPTFDQRIADWLEEDPSSAPREVLGTVLAAFPSIAQRPVLRRPWRSPSMYRFALPAAAALVVVLGAGLLLPRLLTPPAGNPTTSPATSSTAASPSQQPATPPATTTPQPSTSGLVVFQVRLTDGLSRNVIWVQSVDGSISHPLLADQATLLGRTSDGGRVLVALAGEEPSLALVDVDTGARQLVPVDCPSDPCWADSPSPYGTFGTVTLADDDRTAIIVLREEPSVDLSEGRGHESIATIDLATGATTVVEGSRGIFVPGPGLLYPRLSPDGQKVAYIVGDADPTACYGA
jgi:hypothetical protein